MKKTYHPPHTLIDRTPTELDELEASGEIDTKDAIGTRWRKALLGQGYGAATADPELKRYQKMKQQEQQKAAEAETQTT